MSSAPGTFFSGALRQALAEEMERDDRVFVMGEDVGAYGGVFGVTRGLQERFGSRRVFDTPISEAFIVGGAVGAALTGLRPVVELQFADFVSVAMDELYNKAAKWSHIHGNQNSTPLVVRAPEGALGEAGPEHSQCPEGLFWSACGLYVVIPATPYDAKGLLKSAIRDDHPVLFLEHKALYRLRGEVGGPDELVPIGKAAVRREGKDVTVVAWSNFVHRSLEAAERLDEEEISVEVIDPRGIRPFDLETVLRSVAKTGRVLLAHEGPTLGGAGSEVAAMIADEGFASLEAPVKRVGAPDIPCPQSRHLEPFYVPTVSSIVEAVQELARW